MKKNKKNDQVFFGYINSRVLIGVCVLTSMSSHVKHENYRLVSGKRGGRRGGIREDMGGSGSIGEDRGGSGRMRNY
jgi:hypothetical protein